MSNSSFDPESLAARLGNLSYPPVHEWQPTREVDMALHITRHGEWLYQGSTIRRPALVRLLASVMRLETDGRYCLVTPAEKLRITIEDVPFLAVEFEREGSGDHQRLIFRTNVDDIIVAGPGHRLWVSESKDTVGPLPYIHVRGGLNARITRSVYYELAELVPESDPAAGISPGLISRGVFFPLVPPA